MVRTEIKADLLTPVSAFLALRNRAGGAFLFESVEAGSRPSRWTFLGLGHPVIDYRLSDDSQLFEQIRAHLATYEQLPDDGLPPFCGGLVGYIGYDCVRLIEPSVPLTTTANEHIPDAFFMECDVIVAFDHARHTALLMVEYQCNSEGNSAAAYARAQQRLQELREKLINAPPAPSSTASELPVQLQPVAPPEDYERAVARAREYIEAGDCQQVALSQRFQAALSVDPFDIYRALRRINPSPYLFFLQHDGRALVGSSPETMVRVENREMVLRPIAGTRPRGRDAREDDRLVAELRSDPKENAEHVMLVDLARNDIGRVAKIGTVRVDSFREVERYSHVLHLVSQVRGDLADNMDAIDALMAAFPAGTVSGAPKVRAMQLIDELESSRRGPYAGCIGYFSRSGAMDMAITIRTLLCTPGLVSARVGAGIVYDSDPATEQLETRHKAAALCAAVIEAQT